MEACPCALPALPAWDRVGVGWPAKCSGGPPQGDSEEISLAQSVGICNPYLKQGPVSDMRQPLLLPSSAGTQRGRTGARHGRMDTSSSRCIPGWRQHMGWCTFRLMSARRLCIWMSRSGAAGMSGSRFWEVLPEQMCREKSLQKSGCVGHGLRGGRRRACLGCRASPVTPPTTPPDRGCRRPEGAGSEECQVGWHVWWQGCWDLACVGLAALRVILDASGITAQLHRNMQRGRGS